MLRDSNGHPSSAVLSRPIKTGWALVAFLILAGGLFLALGAVQRQSTDQVQDAQRASCARGNVARHIQLRFMLTNAHFARLRAHAGTTPYQSLVNRKAAHAYRREAIGVANSVDGVSADPNGGIYERAVADCELVIRATP